MRYSRVKVQAGTLQVLPVCTEPIDRYKYTSEQEASISLSKTRVCCKLKNAVKLRFYSALPSCQ